MGFRKALKKVAKSSGLSKAVKGTIKVATSKVATQIGAGFLTGGLSTAALAISKYAKPLLAKNAPGEDASGPEGDLQTIAEAGQRSFLSMIPGVFGTSNPQPPSSDSNLMNQRGTALSLPMNPLLIVFGVLVVAIIFLFIKRK
jgi:hypothetical protein